MSDMPVTVEDEMKVRNVINSLLALFTMGNKMDMQLSSYKGLLDGKEVLIIAAIEKQPDGNFSSKPLAVVWDETMHNAIEIPHATKVEWPGA